MYFASIPSLPSPSPKKIDPLPSRAGGWCGRLLPLIFLFLILTPALLAQISANLSGTVTDQSGATVSGAAVTVKDLETGAIRTTTTGAAGQYQEFSLPVGRYEVRVAKQGFAEQIRTGIRLVVGQDARVDVTLSVGPVSQQITVNSDAPLVSETTADVPGLVGEQQVKDLPLNGRSYDLLLPLNPGVVNFTSEKTGGIGISNSTTGNNFAVSGNRPQQNLFLLNGVEYTGAAENNMQPGGASQQLLGVDAVREFNVLRDSYGAEYGKRPGGQVIIVTQSGSNQCARVRIRIPAQQRPRCSQLLRPGFRSRPSGATSSAASLGGPIEKDKTFVFANYEGFRESLHQTSAAFVPDATSRAAAVASVQPLLNLWPTPPSGAPDFSGIAEDFQQSAANHSRGLWDGASRPHFLLAGFPFGRLYHRRWR